MLIKGATDGKSTLVQIMVWCRQATSHYLIQYWPISMSPNGVTRPQWATYSTGVRPYDERFFHRNSHSMEISFCCHPSCVEVIAMKFCTWHDSCAGVPCAKSYSDLIPYHGVTLKQNFHRIWNTMEKSSVKWAPGPLYALWRNHLSTVLGLYTHRMGTVELFRWHRRSYHRGPWARAQTFFSLLQCKLISLCMWCSIKTWYF